MRRTFKLTTLAFPSEKIILWAKMSEEERKTADLGLVATNKQHGKQLAKKKSSTPFTVILLVTIYSGYTPLSHGRRAESFLAQAIESRKQLEITLPSD